VRAREINHKPAAGPAVSIFQDAFNDKLGVSFKMKLSGVYVPEAFFKKSRYPHAVYFTSSLSPVQLDFLLKYDIIMPVLEKKSPLRMVRRGKGGGQPQKKTWRGFDLRSPA
jgi:hypothetical protein